MSDTTDLHHHIVLKYGGSNMADKWESGVFWHFSNELSVIDRSCQNSVAAVRNYLRRSMCWTILLITAAMLQ